MYPDAKLTQDQIRVITKNVKGSKDPMIANIQKIITADAKKIFTNFHSASEP